MVESVNAPNDLCLSKLSLEGDSAILHLEGNFRSVFFAVDPYISPVSLNPAGPSDVAIDLCGPHFAFSLCLRILEAPFSP